MENKTFNGDNGLANHNFHFYYPCGGGDLNSAAEIVDYFKATGFGYAISCREYPGFRAFIRRNTKNGITTGSYTLVLCDHDNYDGDTEIALGQRLTEKKKNEIVQHMTEYCSNHTA